MDARLAWLSIALLPALSGCGNKGALVLAEKPAVQPAPAATETPPAQDTTAPVAPESRMGQDAGGQDPAVESDGDG